MNIKSFIETKYNNLSSSVNQHYYIIHKEMINRLQLSTKSSEGKVNASRIQYFLNQIKRIAEESIGKDVNAFSGLDQEYFKIVEKAFLLQKQARSNSGKRGRLSMNALFNRSSNTKHAKGYDNILEEEIHSIFAALTDDDILASQKVFATGSTKVNVGEDLLDVGKMNKDIFNKLSDIFISKNSQFAGLGSAHRSMQKVQGKSDINVGEIKISSSYPDIQEFQSLIAGKSFSLKNYYTPEATDVLDDSKKNFVREGIHLGNSKFKRSFTSTLSFLGYNKNFINNLYLSTLYHLAFEEQSNSSAIPLHIYHLRFIYELTGAGALVSGSGKGEFVDYLIYNAYTTGPGGQLFVRSSYDLINQELNKPKAGGVLGAITISKKQFFDEEGLDFKEMEYQK